MIGRDTLKWVGPSGRRDRLATMIGPRHQPGHLFPLREVLLLALAVYPLGGSPMS